MPTLNIFCTEISDDAVYLEYRRLSSDDVDGKQIFVFFFLNSSVKQISVLISFLCGD